MGQDGLLPGGERLRRAIRWLGEEKAWTRAGIQEASVRFDLTPNEEEFLLRQFLPGRQEDGENAGG
jgi:hypothetical protein